MRTNQMRWSFFLYRCWAEYERGKDIAHWFYIDALTAMTMPMSDWIGHSTWVWDFDLWFFILCFFFAFLFLFFELLFCTYNLIVSVSLSMFFFQFFQSFVAIERKHTQHLSSHFVPSLIWNQRVCYSPEEKKNKSNLLCKTENIQTNSLTNRPF